MAGERGAQDRRFTGVANRLAPTGRQRVVRDGPLCGRSLNCFTAPIMAGFVTRTSITVRGRNRLRRKDFRLTNPLALRCE